MWWLAKMWLTLHRILYILLFFLYEEKSVDSAIFLEEKTNIVQPPLLAGNKIDHIQNQCKYAQSNRVKENSSYPIYQCYDVHSVCTLLHMFILVEIPAMHATVYLMELAFAFAYILFIKTKQSQRILCCLQGKIDCVCLFCKKWIWYRKQRQFFSD